MTGQVATIAKRTESFSETKSWFAHVQRRAAVLVLYGEVYVRWDAYLGFRDDRTQARESAAHESLKVRARAETTLK